MIAIHYGNALRDSLMQFSYANILQFVNNYKTSCNFHVGTLLKTQENTLSLLKLA
jgi:hypothetical protein